MASIFKFPLKVFLIVIWFLLLVVSFLMVTIIFVIIAILMSLFSSLYEAISRLDGIISLLLLLLVPIAFVGGIFYLFAEIFVKNHWKPYVRLWGQFKLTLRGILAI